MRQVNTLVVPPKRVAVPEQSAPPLQVLVLLNGVQVGAHRPTLVTVRE
jgi:hypothetical protein